MTARHMGDSLRVVLTDDWGCIISHRCTPPAALAQAVRDVLGPVLARQ